MAEIESDRVLERLGKKRWAGEDDRRVLKKAREVVGGNVKEVAEMVLVLSAIGKMRGGRCPTSVEKEIVEEARERLAEVCLKFAPKDVFPGDGFGGVIEDLGINKLTEVSVGCWQPPKMSITEKLLASKRKMEKKQEFSLPSSSYSYQWSQTAMGTATESHSAPHIKMFPQPSHAVNSSGSLQTASPMGRGTPVSSASLPYQLPTSEVRPLITGGVVSGNLVRDSSSVAPPRVGRPHFQMDGRQSGSSHALTVQATTGNNSTGRTPTWSVLPAPVSAARLGSDYKVTPHATIKVEGGADVRSTMGPQVTTSRPFITQSTSGNLPSTYPHLQGTSFIQAPPPSSTHSEIGKFVHKIIQPLLPERPAWTLPSRDYMNKALTCQKCKSTINEVDNVLVCDACENGYHLKCLQTRSQKSVPRGEWHCGMCLSITNGKPLPHKYGRVMRNINSSKMPTIAAVVQSSPDRKAFGPDDKVRQSKIMRNGNVALQNSTTNGMANSLNQLPSAPKMENDQRMGGTDNVSGKENVESIVSSAICSSNMTLGIYSNNLTVTSNDSSFYPACSMISFEENVIEVKSQPPAKPVIVSISFDHSQALNHMQANGHAQLANSVETPSQQFPGSLSMISDAMESSVRAGLANSSSDESKRENQGVGQTNSVETPIARNGDAECVSSTSDLFHSVDWIGDVLLVADEKRYYQSCRHNGFIYNVQEYAVICFEDERLIPSKLLAMWEDTKTGKKWVTVNRCYFSRDLPHAVGRPCSLESNEVYLSNCSTTVMAGQMQGPCEVLPPSKFTEERERISRLETRPNGGLRPLYLCKWIYDESKGLFRDVSC